MTPQGQRGVVGQYFSLCIELIAICISVCSMPNFQLGLLSRKNNEAIKQKKTATPTTNSSNNQRPRPYPGACY